MKTPTKIIEAGNEVLKSIFDTHKEFAKIESAIAETADVTSVDVETISRAASTTSAYLATLAGIVPKYTSFANSSYIFRKFTLMWNFQKIGQEYNTVKEKDLEALNRSEKEHEEELIARYVADYLKNKYDAYEKHVSVLQSRMGILKNEMYR